MVKFTKAPFEDEMNVNLWPRWSAKYSDITKSIRLANPVINQIIKHAPYVGGRRLVLIDVRTQFLQVGFNSTTPGWHRDTPEDPQAMHHLYIIGENRTQFKMPDDSIVELPKGHYASYGPNDVHRGIEVAVEEFRLFVRIQELDYFIAEGKYRDMIYYYSAKFPVDGDTYFIEDDEYFNAFTENYHLNHGAPDA